MEWKKLLSDKRIRDFFIDPNSQKDKNRTEFERDYDRAIFSTPVRRLNDKAQVFPLEPNDSVRTRLTHSLEVSTVARDMARTIGRWLEKSGYLNAKSAEEDVRAIETIAATCGLIHDLGNPPFGHAGEMAMREWFKEKNKQNDFLFFSAAGNRKKQLKNDFLKFEGNAQTLRLVSKLQILSDIYGLNFTCGTMSAACKYIASSDKLLGKEKKVHEKEKVGHFASEELIIDLVRNETDTGEARNPITYIVEAADDIVYSVVDIEDGIRKGVIGWNALKTLLLREQKYIQKENRKKYSRKKLGKLKNCFEGANKIVRKKGAIRLQGKAKDDALAQAFRVCVINAGVRATISTFRKKYKKIMQGDYHNELYKDSEAFLLIETCKKVGQKYVYRAKQNLKLEIMGRHIIQDLMNIFWEGAQKGDKDGKGFDNKIFALMSENYRTAFKSSQNKITVLAKYGKILEKSRGKTKLPKNYCCMQLVTDYICGMTDTFACTLHKRLTNG